MIHGKNQKEHDERLKTVLQRIKKAGMTLNLSISVKSTKQK